jgi:hypothetical protein
MLSANFGSLFRFLDALDTQVVGRQSNRPPPELEARLLLMIQGVKISEEERAGIFDILKKQPGWTAWLAEQVKAARIPPLKTP